MKKTRVKKKCEENESNKKNAKKTIFKTTLGILVVAMYLCAFSAQFPRHDKHKDVNCSVMRLCSTGNHSNQLIMAPSTKTEIRKQESTCIDSYLIIARFVKSKSSCVFLLGRRSESEEQCNSNQSCRAGLLKPQPDSSSGYQSSTHAPA